MIAENYVNLALTEFYSSSVLFSGSFVTLATGGSAGVTRKSERTLEKSLKDTKAGADDKDYALPPPLHDDSLKVLGSGMPIIGPVH